MAFEGREYAYEEFDHRINRTANALVSRGIGPDERVLAHGFDHVDWHTLFYACSKVGATYCPVSTFQSPANLSYITDTFDPAIVAYTGDADIVEEWLPFVREDAPDARYVRLDGGTEDTSFEGWIDGFEPEPPAGTDDHDSDTIHNVFWRPGRPADRKRSWAITALHSTLVII